MEDTILNYEVEEGKHIIRIDGEVIFENSNKIKEKAKNIIKENDIQSLIIDLTDTSYLDSSGIGTILSLFKFMRDRSGKLLITNPNDKVKRVFEVTKLNQILDIYADIEKAIEVS